MRLKKRNFASSSESDSEDDKPKKKLKTADEDDKPKKKEPKEPKDPKEPKTDNKLTDENIAAATSKEGLDEQVAALTLKLQGTMSSKVLLLKQTMQQFANSTFATPQKKKELNNLVTATEGHISSLSKAVQFSRYSKKLLSQAWTCYSSLLATTSSIAKIMELDETTSKISAGKQSKK